MFQCSNTPGSIPQIRLPGPLNQPLTPLIRRLGRAVFARLLFFSKDLS
jgi:hypothetical protein